MPRQPRQNGRSKQPWNPDPKCVRGAYVNRVEMVPQPTFFPCFWQVSQPMPHRATGGKSSHFADCFAQSRARTIPVQKVQKNHQEKAIFTLDKCLDIDFINLLKICLKNRQIHKSERNHRGRPRRVSSTRLSTGFGDCFFLPERAQRADDSAPTSRSEKGWLFCVTPYTSRAKTIKLKA